MTFLDAARKILEQAGQPLHFEEIARRASEQKLITSTGVTPDATMGSRLYTATKQEGSIFVRKGKGTFDLARGKARGIDAQVEAINSGTRERLRELLAAMPPKKFEGLVLDLLLEMGFDETSLKVTPYVRDGGIDVMGVYRAAGLTEVNAAVQVKRWKNNVQAPTVTGLRGSLQVHQQGIIITTGGFSSGARKEAEAPGKTRIGLIDGKQLIELLVKHHVGTADRVLAVSVIDEDWWGELVTLPNGQPPQPQNDTHPEVVTALPAPGISIDVEIGTREEGSIPTRFRTPVSVTLFGNQFAVSTWKQVLLTVVEELARKVGPTFAAQALTIHGRKRYYFRESGEGMINPARVPGTELWIEANQSAVSIKQLTRQFLEAFSFSPSDLTIIERPIDSA